MFYFPYWDTVHNSHQTKRLEIEQWLENELNKYRPIFGCFNKPILLYLSYSITQNGRGYCRDDCFLALSPFVNSTDSYYDTFFQALHEYTHQFTDVLISNISMNDNTHNISEWAVIITDYYLIKTFDPESISLYFNWINKMHNHILKLSTHEDFFNIFKLDNDLHVKLKDTLHNISDTIMI